MLARLLLLFGIISSLFAEQKEPFTQEGNPTADIIELLKITGIDHENSAESIIKATQAQWIRKAGTERWEIDKQQHTYHEELMTWLDKNNFIKELKPSHKKYEYIVIMGGLAQRVKGRVQLAENVLKSGISCKKIIILAGDRPLDEKKELFGEYADEKDKNNESFKIPTTETEMMHYLIERSTLDPEKIEWYAAPMTTLENGQQRRPTTADTVNLWLASSPKAGSCLIISMQPHAPYQDAVVRTLIPSKFTIETIAGTAFEPISDGDYLDNLARWLYQEWEFVKKMNASAKKENESSSTGVKN